MSRSHLGQLITFAIETDEDRTLGKTFLLPVHQGDTVLRIVSRRGHPEDAREVAKLNGIRSTNSLLHRPTIKMPGKLRASEFFNVLAGDTPPVITAGYAKYDTIERPERTGLNVFTGYDPIELSVPIRFEAFMSGEGADIEADIVKLERMAGRGNFPGAAIGDPPVIRVSVTNGDAVVPLIPSALQYSQSNATAPLWRVSGIEWDTSALRNDAGNRIRQLATVTLKQHVRAGLVTRSAAKRAKAAKVSPVSALGKRPKL